MNLLMINASPRVTTQSNTQILLEAFQKGFMETQRHDSLSVCLVQRREWQRIAELMYEHTHIMIAMPLYVESIPGILMEFLEQLDSVKMKHKTLYFILQGGFAEASQLRCAQDYLKKLPSYLDANYGGTLIKGDMFALHLLSPKQQLKHTQSFYDMGKYFSQHPYFEETQASTFAVPEYFSKKAICFQTMIRPLQKLVFYLVAKKLGCKKSLIDQPYQDFVIEGFTFKDDRK